MTREQNAVSASRPACALCLDANSKMCTQVICPNAIRALVTLSSFPGDSIEAVQKCRSMSPRALRKKRSQTIRHITHHVLAPENYLPLGEK